MSATWELGCECEHCAKCRNESVEKQIQRASRKLPGA